MTGVRAGLVVAWLVAGSAGGLTGCFGKSSTGSAASGGQCHVNADCQSGKICTSGVCRTNGIAAPGEKCAVTRDCAAGLYCDPTAVCAKGGPLEAGQSCTTDGQCQAPLRCQMDGFFGTCAPGGTVEAGATCQTTDQCLAGLWCGRDKTCAPLAQAFPPFGGALCRDEGPFRAYFEVPRAGKPPADFFRLPFPNDIRVGGQEPGKLDISDFPKPGPTPLGVDLVQLYVDAWTADFDGFSAAAAVTFRFSGEVDFNTATADTVLLVDVTAGASMGHLEGRAWAISTDRTKYSCNNRFVVRNTTDAPLLPKHTYAAVLTTAIKSTKGEAPAVDPDLIGVLGTTAPSDAALAHAWDAYRPLRDWLAGQGAKAPVVAAAAVFTVQDTTGHMARLAADVAKQPAPVLSALTLCAPGVKSPCDDGTDARACGAGDAAFDEIHGRFSVPIYQAGTPPYDTPDQGGGITEQAGAPVLARTEEVCFALSVPKGPAAAMPAAGWPLVVHHHGTGGSMRSFISDGLASRLAGGARPAAVLGFDAVEHGARRGGSTKKPDDLVFNPLNPRAARDNFLQGAVDILQALRVAALKLDAAASPTGAPLAFDPGAVAFFGHSQGSTSGELALPFTAAVPAAVLSGAGAFLTRSLLEKTKPIDIAGGMTFLLGEPLDAEHPVMTIFQSYFDRSDPLNYNPLLVTRPADKIPSKHIYMSWGTDDTYTPRGTLEANALSLGLPPAGTVLQDYGTAPIARPVTLNLTGGDGAKRTAAVFQYHPGAYDGHFVALQNDAAVADWAAFLQSWLVTGTPAIP